MPSACRTSLISAVIALGCNACAPEIGDECETNFDCSAQNSRPCDRTQPDGYCTIAGCEQGTCPEEAVCVKFRPELERLASTFCMVRCEDDDDCRTGAGYRCLRADDPATLVSGEGSATQGDRSDYFGAPGDAVLFENNTGARFCAVKTMPPAAADAIPDAGQTEERDAATDAGAGRDDDAGAES